LSSTLKGLLADLGIALAVSFMVMMIVAANFGDWIRESWTVKNGMPIYVASVIGVLIGMKIKEIYRKFNND
jgi:hypothetical protein